MNAGKRILGANVDHFGEKGFDVPGVKNFSLFEGVSPSSRNSAGDDEPAQNDQVSEQNPSPRYSLICGQY
jgi:hypothetical protein